MSLGISNSLLRCHYTQDAASNNIEIFLALIQAGRIKVSPATGNIGTAQINKIQMMIVEDQVERRVDEIDLPLLRIRIESWVKLIRFAGLTKVEGTRLLLCS
jgi:hypothetical protein